MKLIANTIVIIALQSAWKNALGSGLYTHSTIDSTLAEVGFIHGSFSHQTMEIANRRYAKNEDLVVLLIDPSKVTAPIKYEAAPSGRPGTFPHIYGPLNTDAVYEAIELKKNADGRFMEPEELKTNL